jgi:hypothetical protein
VYILSSPFASFIHQDFHYYLIGHSRDTISVTAGTEFFNSNKTLNFWGRFSWIASGEHNRDGLKWDWEMSEEAFTKRTPSGTAENKFILSLGAGWQPLPFLSLKACITGIISHNNNHESGINETGGQFSLSVNFIY